MKLMRLSGFVFILILYSCQQDEVIIPGNVPPPDHTVEQHVIENFINKTHISLLGREPSESEFQQNYTELANAGFSVNSRKLYITEIINRDEHIEKIFDNARIEILNNLDTNGIYYIIDQLKTGLSYPGLMDQWPAYQYELDRVRAFRNSLKNSIAGNITITELYRNCVNNNFYDDINMGSENFVVSMFRNFLGRDPTLTEIEKGVKMVDGRDSDLFLKLGSSKSDFLDIFFVSDEYYSGRVNYLFNKYLFRQASSEELEYYSKIYKSNGSLTGLEIEIFATDEYAGI